MNIYIIESVKNRADFESKLQELPKAYIDCFPWPEVTKLQPASFAVVAHNNEALHIHMHTEEPVVRAEIMAQNGLVHTDSCLEFFFMPTPDKSARYINFEVNPLGVFFLAVGTGRHDRQLITEEKADYFSIKALQSLGDWNGKSWDITYSIPFVFIKKYVPEFDAASTQFLRGNFYKCGDKLPAPHWACWNPIDTPKPDFHRPEFFGNLQLE